MKREIKSMFSNEDVKVSGKHMICDIKKIQNLELLHDINSIKKLLDMICEKYEFTVLNKVEHIFEPQGLTILYLLSESHISIHTFPEKEYLALDIYTCRDYSNNNIYLEIYEYIIGAFNALAETPVIIDRCFE
jgi:S-adenosylmethionine decarboxylase proenzyme